MLRNSVESATLAGNPGSEPQDLGTLTAYSPVVLDMLETLIAPGQRMRLSPYVEAAQYKVLFGVEIDPRQRQSDMQQTLETRSKVIEKLATSYVDFARTGKRFSPASYSQDAFLPFYLAYYLPVNVCKVQLMLLEIARHQHFDKCFTVVDLGVGAGTTAIATMDFLLAWTTVCTLYRIPSPVSQINLVGLDASSSCLGYAQQVCHSYANALQWSKGVRQNDNAISALCKPISDWARTATWERADLNSATLALPEGPILLVASNVYNELSNTGKKHLTTLIQGLPERSSIILIEPGNQIATTSLNAWRRELISSTPGLQVLGPCGQEFAENLPLSCTRCWNGRRETFHESQLYHRVRKAVEHKTGSDRDDDPFDNHFLSWSYAILSNWRDVSVSSDRLVAGSTGVLQVNTVASRYVGRYSSGRPTEFRPDIAIPGAIETGSAVEYIRLCPGKTKKQLELVRHAGTVVPKLAHGQFVTISGVMEQKYGEATYELLPTENEELAFETSSTECDTAHWLHFDTGDGRSEIHDAINQLAYRLFGFAAMHAFQHRILERVLSGRSILGIAATGGGKSECYILPAMILPGITIVISPLKSLMQDQYDQRLCKRYGLHHLATYINGDVPFKERQARLKRLELGYYKILYVTPEQLEYGYVLDAVKRADERVGVRYVAFDEAHCISQWGHDFRPSYLNIVQRLRNWGLKPVCIALTATASPEVVEDICEELDLINQPVDAGGDVYIDRSNRPELNLIVRVVRNTEDKVACIVDDLSQLIRANDNNTAPGAAIVFMPKTGGHVDNHNVSSENANTSRIGRLSAGATQFASFLERTLQTDVAIYHSKMDADIRNDEAGQETSATSWLHPDEENSHGDMQGRTRANEQERFISGACTIMVATKGFGMGIDKPNIRRVIHRTPPGNLEAYAQEAGRAGRDGDIADAILYYSADTPIDEQNNRAMQSDYGIQDFFLRDRYVRQIDVIIMRAFFQTVKHQIGGRLYFTSDEVIDFLDLYNAAPSQSSDACTAFFWPTFPEREPLPVESAEHKAILQRGHIYQQKTDYVGRILKVLYRVRPSIDGQKRLSFIESIETPGARLVKLGAFNATAIRQSNEYFGTLFRSRNVSASEIEEWLKSTDNDSLLEFARFLGITLKEMNTILWDIHRGDGSFDKRTSSWQSNLLNFRTIAAPFYGSASGKASLQQRRQYAGAKKRAKPSRKGAKRRPNGSIGLDEWFGISEVCWPVGWEVELGTAFTSGIDFDAFLEVFLRLNDRREKQDRDSYRLLLTDYIGVSDKGRLRPHTQKHCLRNVMLGYFKTGEAVIGGNCRSCSTCVPDGRFEQDMEVRRQLVARLPGDFLHIVHQLEYLARAIPPIELIDLLWEIVGRYTEQRRSLLEYIAGWTNRLLQDTPDHQAARLIRLTGIVRDLLPESEAEALQHLQPLVDAAAHREALWLEAILDHFLDIYPNSGPLLVLRARLLERLLRFRESAEAWLHIANTLPPHDDVNYRLVYQSLSELYKISGPLPDRELHAHYQRFLARYALDEASAINILWPIVPSWSWEILATELAAHESGRWDKTLPPQIVQRWLDGHPSSEALSQVVALIVERKFYEFWDADTTMQIIMRLTSEERRLDRFLMAWWLDRIAVTANACRVDPTTFVTEAIELIGVEQSLSAAACAFLTTAIFKGLPKKKRDEIHLGLKASPVLLSKIGEITLWHWHLLHEQDHIEWLGWFGTDMQLLYASHRVIRRFAGKSERLAVCYLDCMLRLLPNCADQIADFVQVIIDSGISWATLSQVFDIPDHRAAKGVPSELVVLMAHVEVFLNLERTRRFRNRTSFGLRDHDTLLVFLKSVAGNVSSLHLAMMYAAIFGRLVQLIPAWEAHLAGLLHAYAHSGRKQKAVEVANRYPNLTVGKSRVPVLNFVEGITPSQEDEDLEEMLERITADCIKRWAIAGAALLH